MQIEKFLVPESAHCEHHGLAPLPNFTVQWFLIICVIKVNKLALWCLIWQFSLSSHSSCLSPQPTFYRHSQQIENNISYTLNTCKQNKLNNRCHSFFFFINTETHRFSCILSACVRMNASCRPPPERLVHSTPVVVRRLLACLGLARLLSMKE